jgi:hypothetical protein
MGGLLDLDVGSSVPPSSRLYCADFIEKCGFPRRSQFRSPLAGIVRLNGTRLQLARKVVKQAIIRP